MKYLKREMLATPSNTLKSVLLAFLI